MKNLKNISGKYYEDLVEDFLKSTGLKYKSQVRIGQTLFGKDLISDFVVEWESYLISIECKHQATRGSAEEKIYYTAHSLINLHNQYSDLITVLLISGGGWSKQCISYMKKWEKTHPLIITTVNGLKNQMNNNFGVWFYEKQAYLPKKELFDEQTTKPELL